MKSFSFFIFLAAIVFLAFACKKKDLLFILEGTVSDASFQAPCNAGKVKLFKVPVGTIIEELIGEQTLIDGSYSFTFDRDRSEKYILYFEREDYFVEKRTVFFSAFTANEPLQLDFQVYAKAYMNWVVKDVIPVSEFANCSVVKLNGRTDGNEACPNGTYEFFGGGPADTLRCAVNGNTFIRFNIVKLPSFTLDSVFCPAFEEVYFNVDY